MDTYQVLYHIIISAQTQRDLYTSKQLERSSSMNKEVQKKSQHPREEEWDAEEYSDMELLEMLESVREDMEELGVTTLQEVIERIETLHRHLDAR